MLPLYCLFIWLSVSLSLCLYFCGIFFYQPTFFGESKVILITSIPWVVGLSWLENAYSRPFLVGDFDPTVGQAVLVFGVQSGFISMSVRGRLQVSVCSGYDLCHPG